MQTTFRLNAAELNEQFLEAVKMLFRDKELTITVQPASNGHSEADDAMDETEFLMSNPANYARLLESMRHAEEGKLITVDIDKILAGAHPSEAIISSYETNSVL
ncbi:MAG: hypothetical protein EAZ92_13620 [Candidatus Kapaibacterium sp.]|nr:MAG: hypothetical protein EAZ92_13620 [Candidatus Kapabacteria bacterium]